MENEKHKEPFGALFYISRTFSLLLITSYLVSLIYARRRR